MSSKENLRFESMITWLEFPIGNNSYVAELRTRLNQLNALRRELSPTANNFMYDDLMKYAGMSNECIFCLARGEELVATAQMSLLFPSMKPTAYVSGLVVAQKERGKGYGRHMLTAMIKYAEEERTFSEHGPVRLMLTSRPERGTENFYTALGFTGTPTIRYTK